VGRHSKPFWAISQQAEIIKEIQPDVLVLEEVSSEKDLHFINRELLGDQYQVLFHRGNDLRGFEIGFLVRKGLPFDFRYVSHRHLTFFDPVTQTEQPVFSRDAPTLIATPKGSPDVAFVVIGQHAKSKRDRAGDPESFMLRAQQMRVLQKLIESYQGKFGEETPIIVAGDFNTDLHNSLETHELFTIMTDVFDLLARPPPSQERITHSYHQPSGGHARYQQLDGILVTKASQVKVHSAQVYRYKDRSGQKLPLPIHFRDRAKQPSDHFPIWAELEIIIP
jgi:endonuclease/exonuclease/phosphatase family metal-dependent hydrolase